MEISGKRVTAAALFRLYFTMDLQLHMANLLVKGVALEDRSRGAPT
jgi:hypothetical protein